MRRVFMLVGLLLVLGACTPAVQELPSAQPYVFGVDYDTLFDATLQTVASTRVSTFSTRASFAIYEADLETGLINAVRLGRNRVSGVGTAGAGRLHSGVGRLGFGFQSGSISVGFSTLGRTQPDQTLISIVVRPAGEGAASLAYSSTATDSADLRLANIFMAEVIQNLLTRFGTTIDQ